MDLGAELKQKKWGVGIKIRVSVRSTIGEMKERKGLIGVLWQMFRLK